MWAPNDKRWLIPGGIFTALVVGLLIYLHVFATVTVPRNKFEAHGGAITEAHWDREKALYVCEAPDWVSGNAEAARSFVADVGVKYTALVNIEGPCSTSPDLYICSYGEGKDKRETWCARDGVVLTMADSKYNFGTMEEGGHGDETLVSADWTTGVIKQATAQFPEDLESIKAFVVNDDAKDAESMIEDIEWPSNAEFLVVVHALLHAEGYDHVVTELAGPFYAEPTGHIMARNIPKLGESTAGL